MVEKEIYRKRRNRWTVAGIGLAFLALTSSQTSSMPILLCFVLSIFALGSVIYGCYCWTKYKGRSKWLCLLGVIASLGFLPLAILKDKNIGQSMNGQTSSAGGV